MDNRLQSTDIVHINYLENKGKKEFIIKDQKFKTSKIQIFFEILNF
jgi:hypothetical protein